MASAMRILVRAKKQAVRHFCRTFSILCLVVGAALGLFELLSALGDQPLLRAEALQPAILAAAFVFLTGLLVSRARQWSALEQKAEEPKIDVDDIIHRVEWFDEHRRRSREHGG